VEVHDNGTGRPSRPEAGTRAGHGLAGMRERAAVYDGTVSAGPHPAGGWLVHVRLPLPADATTMLVADGCAQ
jgi:signal transduction histidine kinase